MATDYLTSYRRSERREEKGEAASRVLRMDLRPSELADFRLVGAEIHKQAMRQAGCTDLDGVLLLHSEAGLPQPVRQGVLKDSCFWRRKALLITW